MISITLPFGHLSAVAHCMVGAASPVENRSTASKAFSSCVCGSSGTSTSRLSTGFVRVMIVFSCNTTVAIVVFIDTDILLVLLLSAAVTTLFCTVLTEVVESAESTAAGSPGSPLGPCGPVSPVSPFGPCGPVSPVSPFGPCGPVSPFSDRRKSASVPTFPASSQRS